MGPVLGVQLPGVRFDRRQAADHVGRSAHARRDEGGEEVKTPLKDSFPNSVRERNVGDCPRDGVSEGSVPKRSLGTRFMIAFVPFLVATDWPQFRGPHGNGTSDETSLPTKW